jgi:hypothetical protein
MPETMTRVLPTSSPAAVGFEQATKVGAELDSRVPPAIRKVSANYQAVSMDEAAMRMKMRIKGEMPPIDGGLDGPGTVDPVKAKRYRLDVPTQPADDPAQPSTPTKTAEPSAAVSGVLEQLAKLLAAQMPTPPPPPVPEPVTPLDIPKVLEHYMASFKPLPYPGPQAAQSQAASSSPAYLAQRKRVSFTVSGGTYSVPAVDVRPCTAGLVILLPMDKESATFVPSLGAEVTVGFQDKQWPCFFPGVAVEFSELNVQMLCFIKQNDQQV